MPKSDVDEKVVLPDSDEVKYTKVAPSHSGAKPPTVDVSVQYQEVDLKASKVKCLQFFRLVCISIIVV